MASLEHHNVPGRQKPVHLFFFLVMAAPRPKTAAQPFTSPQNLRFKIRLRQRGELLQLALDELTFLLAGHNSRVVQETKKVSKNQLA